MKNLKIKNINIFAFVLVVLLMGLTMQAHASVGKIVYGYGNNYAFDSDGNRRDLKKGTKINQGDTLVTGRGRVHVRLIDGGFISVYPNSEYKIEQFEFSGKTASNKTSSKTGNSKKSETVKEVAESKKDRGFFSLLKGAARQVTGLIGRKYNDNFKLKTSVATIGIRGTGFFARLCQADCFDANGNPIQDGMYIKNNTGVITMTTNAGEVALAQGQSAFAASSEDSPQQTVQPPIAHNLVVPDIELFDFDNKIYLSPDIEVGMPEPTPLIDPPAPSVILTNMEYVTSDETFFPAQFGGLDTANPEDSIVQNGDEISSFQGIGVYIDAGVLNFDKDQATLEESGSDATLGVLWNRWSSGYTFTEGGSNVPSGPEAGNDIHLIGSDNITPNLAGLTGRGIVSYVNTGGTSPTISGLAGNQVGTQSLNVSIDYASGEIRNFQLDTTFGVGAAATTMSVNLQTVEYLTGTSGNSVALDGGVGGCTGPGCGVNGDFVSGQASINLVGPNAEGLYGAYNLTNNNNAVSGSYLATDTSIPQN